MVFYPKPPMGMIPRTAADMLPENAAQSAVNVDLRGGVWTPMSIETTDLHSLHTATGKLVQGIPTEELTSITRPIAPTAATPFVKMCLPRSFLSIRAYAFKTWIGSAGTVEEDPVSGHQTNPPTTWEDVTITDVKYTDVGLLVIGTLPSVTAELTGDVPYNIYGPIFRFDFAKDATGAYGGPNAAISLPDSLIEIHHTSPRYYCGAVPLYYGSRIYGFFQTRDYQGPVWDDEVTLGVTDSFSLEGGTVAFLIDLNYAQQRQLQYKFVTSSVDDQLREGPPSEISATVTVNPGEILKMNTPMVSPYKHTRLYRSDVGGRKFYLVDDLIDVSTWTDDGTGVQAVELPPYGNWDKDSDNNTRDVTSADFLEYSVIHPAQFAATIYNDEITEAPDIPSYYVMLSEPYKWHVWPEEYAVKFADPIKALAIAGDSIMVFTNTRVYSLNGSDPAHMVKRDLSDANPLLNKLGMARIGQTIYWVSNEGLMATDGGNIQNVTAEFYTKAQWAALEPASLKAKSYENSILLEHATDSTKNIRVDIGEQAATISKWTALTGGTMTWKSRRIRFARKEIYDWAWVVSDGTVTLRVYSDAVTPGTVALAGTYTLTSGKWTQLTGLAHALNWEFEIESTATIREIKIPERQVISLDGEIRLTPENVTVWGDTWLKFPDADKFVAGALSIQGTGTAYVDFMDKAGTVKATAQVDDTSGRVFTTPRALVAQDYWRVCVRTDDAAPFNVNHIDELLLAPRRTVPISGSIQELNLGGISPWLVKRYSFTGRGRVKTITVHASKSVTMNLYYDGAETASKTLTVSNSNEIRVTGEDRFGFVEFDFNGEDALVASVAIKFEQIVDIGANGIYITNPDEMVGNTYKFADRGTFACGSVAASSYPTASPVTLKLYRDGTLAHTQTVTNGYLFTFPRTLTEGSAWEVEATCADTTVMIYSVMLIPWRREMAQGDSLHNVSDDTGVMPWPYTRHQFENGILPVSGCVDSESYPVTMTVFPDKAATGTAITVSDGNEFVIPGMTWCDSIDVSFGTLGADNYKVNEFVVYGKTVEKIKNAGIFIRGSESMPMRQRYVTFKDTGSFNVVRVVADDYTGMVFKLYSGGTLRQTVSITDDSEILLDRNLPWGRDWMWDLASAGPVREFYLIGRVDHRVSGGVVKVSNESDPFTWLGQRILSDTSIAFSCGRVQASAYPVTLRLRADGKPVYERAIHDSRAFRLIRMAPNREWEFDIVKDDGIVVHEAAFATAMERLAS